MTYQDLLFKINDLKIKLDLWREGNELKGIALFFENSSENWLFNSKTGLDSLVPIICESLENEIKELETQLAPLKEEQDKLDAIAAQQQAEQLATAQQEQAKQEELNQLFQRMEKGRRLISRYILENSKIKIAPEQSIQLAATLGTLKTLLESGSLGAALVMIEGLPIECFPVVEPYLTNEERKQSYISEL